MLIASATEDKYSRDARALYEAAKPAFSNRNVEHAITLKEYVGGHPLDEKRFSDIIAWFVDVMNEVV